MRKKGKVILLSFLLVFILPFAFSEHYNIVSQKPIEEEKIVLLEKIYFEDNEDDDDDDDDVDDTNEENFFIDQNLLLEDFTIQNFLSENFGEEEVSLL